MFLPVIWLIALRPQRRLREQVPPCGRPALWAPWPRHRERTCVKFGGFVQWITCGSKSKSSIWLLILGLWVPASKNLMLLSIWLLSSRHLILLSLLSEITTTILGAFFQTFDLFFCTPKDSWILRSLSLLPCNCCFPLTDLLTTILFNLLFIGKTSKRNQLDLLKISSNFWRPTFTLPWCGCNLQLCSQKNCFEFQIETEICGWV